jgi:mannose-6-phosphate isomerase-like protein (cupin superfamily)
MVIRSLDSPEVKRSEYIAHRGAIAHMLLDSSILEGIEFLAHAAVEPGMEIEAHRDTVEEIYYILEGRGVIMVDGEWRDVKKGDSIWIPQGSLHAFRNPSPQGCEILVVAAYPKVI